MGIRFLQSFTTGNVKRGLFDIDIKDEIEKYKKTHNGQVPTIVVDLLTFSRIIFGNNKHEILVGGRYNVYNDRAFELFNKLKSLDVNLVFFVDGLQQDDKLPTMLKRRNENYEKAMSGLRFIYSAGNLSTFWGKTNIQDPVPFLLNLTNLAARFGEVHFTILNECDLELAEYATRNNALAVISNDSDFLVYEGDWHYWSSNHLDIVTLRTKEYNKKSLRDTLGLRSDQMAIWATMCGNDVVLYDSVKGYHNKLRSTKHGSHFCAVAIQVQRLRCTLDNISQDNIKTISQLIFQQSEQKSGEDLIKKSLQSYDYTKMRTKHTCEIFNHIPNNSGRLTYVILGDVEYILQLYYFDLSKNDIIPFYELVSPLIRRYMGILLKHENSPNITRTFFCKLDHLKPYERIIEQPEYPTCTVPPIVDLLTENKELDDIRINLYCWQISPNLRADVIRNLPRNDVINAVTLFYLFELKVISKDEADCLLLANYCPNKLRGSLQLAEVNRINERDARLAFLFTIMEIQIKNCLLAVGLKKLDSLITFDGLYFHSLRRKWSQINDNEKSIILTAYNYVRIYAT